MRPLKTYIEYLVMTRHYANVPGWGAYILNETASTALRSINAPSMTITFSNTKRKDDGILAGIIMEMEGIGYDEAISYINSELHTLQTQDIHVHNSGNLYGLQSLDIKPWKELPRTVTFTLPGMWMRRIAVVALILLAFCMGSNTTMQNEQETYASICDARIFGDIFTQNPVEETLPNEDSETVVSAESDVTALNAESDATALSAEASDSSISSETTPTYLSGKQYFMIVGSLSSRQDAEKQIQIMSRRGIGELGILERDGKFRLYIQTTETFDEAKQILKQMREIPALSKVWINPVTVSASEHLKPLNSSLLTNKKNKYNDNQVSVELSHLNTRTGRDKG